MELIRGAAEQALLAAQLPAEESMPFGPVERVREPRITVKVRRCETAGPYSYLGMYETEGDSLELYGHLMRAELAAAVHTPVSGGAPDCAALAEQTADCWMSGADGLQVQRVVTQTPSYDAELDCFVCEVCADVSAWIYALPVEDGLYFEDFAIKGRLFGDSLEERT